MQENGPDLRQQVPGRGRQSKRTGTPDIAPKRRSRQRREWIVTDMTGETKNIVVTGRVAWMMERLVEVGPVGVTTFDHPGVRLSHYVMCLRQEGVDIETRREPHGGAFPGRHGRYRLVSEARRADQ
ncbi:winged helix domain-containing protein [Wenxinia marina]|nr:hypothetical protein [Wenxinia marina]